MPSIQQTTQATATQQTETQAAQKKTHDSLRTVRNVALGTAAAGGAAMAAEAASILALPAIVPTGMITTGALVTAGATHAMLKLGEWMERVSGQGQENLKKASGE